MIESLPKERTKLWLGVCIKTCRGRAMQTFESRTIGEIALTSPAATRILEEYKIDYCCHGKMLFSEACKKAGVDVDVVETRLIDLMAVDAKSDLEVLPTLSLAELITYIVEKHHIYTKKELEQLGELSKNTLEIHGERHPELIAVNNIFSRLSEDLIPHMMKEEIVLFPYIADLESNVNSGKARRKPHFGSVTNPIGMMAGEHEHVAALLMEMRAAAGNYRVPSDGCPSYRSFYARLAELERDLHQHIHLENNLLFVKAVELDEQADLLSN